MLAACRRKQLVRLFVDQTAAETLENQLNPSALKSILLSAFESNSDIVIITRQKIRLVSMGTRPNQSPFFFLFFQAGLIGREMFMKYGLLCSLD